MGLELTRTGRDLEVLERGLEEDWKGLSRTE